MYGNLLRLSLHQQKKIIHIAHYNGNGILTASFCVSLPLSKNLKAVTNMELSGTDGVDNDYTNTSAEDEADNDVSWSFCVDENLCDFRVECSNSDFLNELELFIGSNDNSVDSVWIYFDGELLLGRNICDLLLF